LEARGQRGQRIELLCGESEDFHLAIGSDIGGTRESIQNGMSPNIIPGEKVAMRFRAALSIDTDTLAVPETRIYISLGVSPARMITSPRRKNFRTGTSSRCRLPVSPSSDGIAFFEPHAPQTARCRAVAGEEATFPIFQSQIQIFKEVDLYVSFSKHPGQSGQVAGAGDRHEFSGADQSFDEPCQQSATNKIDRLDVSEINYHAVQLLFMRHDFPN
jgi:hypothetical protein